MEFMHETLKKRITENTKLDEKTTSHFTHQITRGLAFLHSKYVIHCDIKPENILLTVDGVAKLADFGLSIITVENDFFREVKGEFQSQPAYNDMDANLKNLGGIKGTLTHMSPEMAKEKAVGFAADIFSLGVTVIEMLTGDTPRHVNPCHSTLANLCFRSG